MCIRLCFELFARRSVWRSGLGNSAVLGDMLLGSRTRSTRTTGRSNLHEIPNNRNDHFPDPGVLLLGL